MPTNPLRRALALSAATALSTSLLSGLALAGSPALAGLAPARVVADPVTTSADDAALALEPLGTHRSGVFDESAAEIVAFDPGTARAFVVNAQSGRIDVLDAADPSDPTLVDSLAAAGVVDARGDVIPAGAVANSVVVREDGLVVAAIESDVKTDDGWLVVATADDLAVLGAVRVGALPDMVTLTPDGSRAVVANEGEPSEDHTVDPEGSVSVVDLPTGRAAPAQSAVRTATFHAWEADGDRTLDPRVRVFGPEVNTERPVSANLEPEYVAVDPAGDVAYVALQEANAVAEVDLDAATVTEIRALGTKDHSAPGQGLDPSDRDDGIAIGAWPVRGMYQPDAMVAYEARGQTYLVTANEGDAREWGDYVEPARVKDLGKGGRRPLCAGAAAAGLTGDAQLGRLNVSTADGLSADGSCHEELFAFGARSFSIWTSDGARVFDSGEALEQVVAEAVPEYFNSNHTASNLEGRSDDKGPEPESVAVGQVGERTYAFVGLERVGGVAAFDVTDPVAATFVTYVNNRDFSVSVADAEDPEAVLDDAGDLGPEGVAFIAAEDSPTDQPLLAVGNEVSGTTTFFGITDLAQAPDERDLVLELDRDAVPAGGTLTGTVLGAGPEEELTLTLVADGEDEDEGIVLGTVVTGADGTADFSLDVPVDTAAGAYRLVAAGESGTAEADLVVTDPVGGGGGNDADDGGGEDGDVDGGPAVPVGDVDGDEGLGALLPAAGSPLGLLVIVSALAALAAGVVLLRRRTS